MATFRIGNSLMGTLPAQGAISDLRVGGKMLGTHEVHLADLRDITPRSGNYGTVVVDEVESLLSRQDDPHMSPQYTMFCPLKDTEEGSWDEFWTRPNFDVRPDMAGQVPLTQDDADDESDLVGLRIRVRREPRLERVFDPRAGEMVDSDVERPHATSCAWFDNSRMLVSGVLWEFSNDGGHRWYPMYDIANTDYTRMNLPGASDRIRARAWSSDPSMWVQGIAVFPKPDSQAIEMPQLEWNAEKVFVDEFGYMFWDAAENGVGDIVYEVYRIDKTEEETFSVWPRLDGNGMPVLDDNGDMIFDEGDVVKEVENEVLLGWTRECSYQLPEYDFATEYNVVAVDEVGNSISKRNELYRLVGAGGNPFGFDIDGLPRTFLQGDGEPKVEFGEDGKMRYAGTGERYDGTDGIDGNVPAIIGGSVGRYWENGLPPEVDVFGLGGENADHRYD